MPLGAIGDFFGGSKSEKTVVSKIFNDLLSESFLSVTNSCQNFVDLKQSFTVLALSEQENTKGCERCFTDILANQEATYAHVRATWNTSKKRKPIDKDVEWAQLLASVNACKNACKAYHVDELSQTMMFSWNASCQFTDTMKTEMVSDFGARIQQSLVSQKDVFSSLAGVLGKADSLEVTTELTNRLSDRLSVTILNQMLSRIKNEQSVVSTSDSAQLNVGRITQTSAFTGVASLMAQSKVGQSMLSTQEWDLYQSLYLKNTTIDDAGNAIEKTFESFKKAIQSGPGLVLAILIGILLLILTILLFIAGLRVWQGQGS